MATLQPHMDGNLASQAAMAAAAAGMALTINPLGNMAQTVRYADVEDLQLLRFVDRFGDYEFW